MIAVKITNNSEKELIFGKDIKLVYENGNEINTLETETVFKKIKQSPASYLWYLLLTPTQFNKTSTSSYNQTTTSSTPIGLLIGPGLAGANIIAASSANSNFKKELIEYDINGKTIKKGETVYGLIGINSSTYDSIKIKVQ